MAVHDTEAFARRAALGTICDWVHMNQFSTDHAHIYDTLCILIKDMDWQVKLKVLNFWENQYNQLKINIENSKADTPSYAVELSIENNKRKIENHDTDCKALIDKLQEFGKKGGLYVILMGSQDYDQSVQHQACKLLESVKHLCEESGVDLPGCSHPKRKMLSKNIEPVNMDTTSSDIPTSKLDIKQDIGVLDFLENVENIDLKKMLDLTSQSIDEYQRNPEMLLQDILISLKPNEDEDNAIDCY